MPRRMEAPKREILPDPVYNSKLVTKFINNVTRKGKKTTAERMFYGALSLIEERSGDDPLKVFKRAVDNTRPQVEVKSRRVGGSTYQVPVEVKNERIHRHGCGFYGCQQVLERVDWALEQIGELEHSTVGVNERAGRFVE